MFSAARMVFEVNMTLAIIFAAGAEVAMKYENTTPDEMLILWCLIGGVCGSACSLRFFKPASHLEGFWQMVTNLVIAGNFSPFVVDQVAWRLNFPVGLRMALPIAWTIGLLGTIGINRLLPFLDKWFTLRSNKILKNEE